MGHVSRNDTKREVEFLISLSCLKAVVKLSYNQAISNLTVNNVQVNGAGGYGLNVDGVTGTGTFSYMTVTGAALGGLHNTTYTIVRGAGNSGW
jgi:hypothetical protein